MVTLSSFSLSMLLLFAAVLLAAALFAGAALGRRTGRLEAERQLPDMVDAERQDAVKRSRAVLGGQVAEQVAPYLPAFPCDPADVRFLGKPVDFVCFSGASGGEVKEIIFVEVKSGSSTLSKIERSAREAIIAGKVRWVEYRLPAD